MHPQAGSFAFIAQEVGLGRALTIDFNLSPTIRLPRLNTDTPFVQENGNPTLQAQQWWQTFAERLEAAYGALAGAVIAIQAAYDAAAQASTAATAASNAATAAQSTADASAETLTALQSGDLVLDSINIGGQVFVNNGGSIEAEP